MQERFIVGLGEALWDCLPDGSKLGGAPANFAYHVHQFGFDAMAISALGNDILGDETRKQLNEKGLNYIMPLVDYPTGTVQVTLDDEGVPTYDIKENVAWDNIPFNSEIETVAKNARAVCFGSLAQRNSVSRTTIHRFLEATPKDCLKIFDINLRQNFYTTLHPQTQGKIERYHRSMKNVIKLNHYFCPSELEKAIDEWVKYYNERRFHESLDNLTPRDVYLGQGEKIKKIRETIKQNSINKRISEHKRMKLQHK